MNFNHKLFFNLNHSFEEIIPSSFNELKANLLEANDSWNISQDLVLVMENMEIYLFILNDKIENPNNNSYKFTDFQNGNKIVFPNIIKS